MEMMGNPEVNLEHLWESQTTLGYISTLASVSSPSYATGGGGGNGGLLFYCGGRLEKRTDLTLEATKK